MDAKLSPWHTFSGQEGNEISFFECLKLRQRFSVKKPEIVLKLTNWEFLIRGILLLYFT